MKNLLIFSSFLLFVNIFYCQNSAGYIEYSLVYKDNDEISTSEIGGYFKSAKDNSKYVNLILEFNKEGMLFYNSTLAVDGADVAFSLAFCGFGGKYHKKNGSDVTRNFFYNSVLEDVIVEKNEKLSWSLYKESKKINNFLCYKASAIIKYNNGVGDFKKDLIVWYCPQIPYAYGPYGRGSLPGIILEYQYDNFVIGAKKIVFDENLKIKIPAEGKLMTESDYLQQLNMKLRE
jgi:GLPGLI family protein